MTIEEALRTYSLSQLATMRDALRTELQEREPSLTATLETLCRCAPGSEDAAFAALLAVVPAHSLYRPRLRTLRVITRYIAAQESRYATRPPEPLPPLSTGEELPLPLPAEVAASAAHPLPGLPESTIQNPQSQIQP